MTTVSIRSAGRASIPTASFMRRVPTAAPVRRPRPCHRPYGRTTGGEIGSSPHPEADGLDGGGQPWSAGGSRQRPRLGEPCAGEEAVLHGEQGGTGPGGDADLPVGVLDVAVGGLDRDPQPPCGPPCLQGSRKEIPGLHFPLR